MVKSLEPYLTVCVCPSGRVTPTALIQYMVKSLEPYLTVCVCPSGRVTPTALIQYMVKSLEPYLTVCVCPSGQVTPTALIQYMVKSLEPYLTVCVCPSGRVTPTALIQYMVKSLEPYLTAGGVSRPILIYVDGLRHHCSMTLTQFCDDEGIILVGLPPGGQARNPLQQAVTSLLAANFDRLVAETRLGRRRAGPSGGMTISLKYLLAGIRQACRRVCKQTVAQAFT